MTTRVPSHLRGPDEYPKAHAPSPLGVSGTTGGSREPSRAQRNHNRPWDQHPFQHNHPGHTTPITITITHAGYARAQHKPQPNHRPITIWRAPYPTLTRPSVRQTVKQSENSQRTPPINGLQDSPDKRPGSWADLPPGGRLPPSRGNLVIHDRGATPVGGR